MFSSKKKKSVYVFTWKDNQDVVKFLDVVLCTVSFNYYFKNLQCSHIEGKA